MSVQQKIVILLDLIYHSQCQVCAICIMLTELWDPRSAHADPRTNLNLWNKKKDSTQQEKWVKLFENLQQDCSHRYATIPHADPKP